MESTLLQNLSLVAILLALLWLLGVFLFKRRGTRASNRKDDHLVADFRKRVEGLKGKGPYAKRDQRPKLPGEKNGT